MSGPCPDAPRKTAQSVRKAHFVAAHSFTGEFELGSLRLRVVGRMAPEGLSYMSSWVDENFERGIL